MKTKLVVVAGATVALVLATVFLSGVLVPPKALTSSHEEGWTFVVDGLVNNSINVTYNDLLAMPSVTVKAKLQCVDDPNGLNAPTSDWTGVPLKAILERVGVSKNATKIVFYAVDGYSTDLTLETASRSDIIIAYKRDGEFISGLENGSTSIQLVVPGKWGYKWIKWLNHIKIVGYNYLGTWESKGYSDEADVQ